MDSSPRRSCSPISRRLELTNKTDFCCSTVGGNKRKEYSSICACLRSCLKPRLPEHCGGAKKLSSRLPSLPPATTRERSSSNSCAFLHSLVPLKLDENHCLGFLAGGIQAELTVAAPADFPALLLARTGAPSHLAKFATLALSQGITLCPGPAGRTGGGQAHFQNEREIYQRLGLQYIPPELREDEGEIEAARTGTLPQPLVREDICGMTHCHTVYSDGRNSIEELALAAQAMGMSYLTITDHSPSAHYAGGVSIDRLRAQWDEIARVQERVKIKLLKGTESDILEDGVSTTLIFTWRNSTLSSPASMHARNTDFGRMTRRLLRAL